MTIEADLRAMGFGIEGLLGTEIALHKFAEKVADKVKENTPVFGESGRDERRESPPHGEPGDARDAIHVENNPKNREGLRVISRDYKAVWIELGSTHHPEDAPFAKAASYFGGTGPEFEEGIHEAQGKLRQELERFEKLTAEGAEAAVLAESGKAVRSARIARSAAFKAARPRRGRR